MAQRIMRAENCRLHRRVDFKISILVYRSLAGTTHKFIKFNAYSYKNMTSSCVPSWWMYTGYRCWPPSSVVC